MPQGDGVVDRRPIEEADATERRAPSKTARRESDQETAWNVPPDKRQSMASPEAQWTESDFERISQTAGLPREDPRAREPKRRRTGFRPWRRQPPGRSALGGVVAAGRAVKADARVVWIAGTLALAAVGATAGWVAGRWDEESWIARQYQLATDLMRSVKPLPNMLDGATPAAGLPAAEGRAAADAQAIAPAGPAASTNPSAQVAGTPAVVDPRPTIPPAATQPAAIPPAAIPPADGRRTAAVGRSETSLVPIKPTSAPAPLADAAAPPPAFGSEPWSVRDVQRELARLGYYQGGVDGEVGPMTRSAVRAFQQDVGMSPTGRIEPALLTALSDRVAGNPTSTNKPKGSP